MTPFSDLEGEVVLDNARVHVQRYIVPSGQAIGCHACSHAHLVIYVRGGVIADDVGRRVVWNAGVECVGSTATGRWSTVARTSGDEPRPVGIDADRLPVVSLKQ